MEKDKDLCTVLVVEDDNDLCRILENVVGKLCPVHVEHDLHHAKDSMENRNPRSFCWTITCPTDWVLKISAILLTYARMQRSSDDIRYFCRARCQALGEGAVAFLIKPFREAHINELILSICPELRAA